LFGHVWTDDPDHLDIGLENLRIWLEDNLEETEEGFEVNTLDQEQVDALDNCKRDASGLLGAAVATRSDYAVEDMVRTNIDVPARDVYDRVVYQTRKDFTPDKDCFLDQECERLQYRSLSESILPLGINVKSKNGVQHRWIETDHGTANVYRTWLQKPAIISWDSMHIDTQFYLSAALPWDNGTIRLQATWAATSSEALPVTESMALNLTINTMRENDEAVTAYLDAK